MLLVTEEDYGSKPCDTAGSFQTWHVQRLRRWVNPDGDKGGGQIVPLDLWTTELLDGSTGLPAAGALCSAHYFDYHPAGFGAQGWYQQGVRILDVRDPTDIKQVGYFFTGASEAWDAYWVPRRDGRGRVKVDRSGEVLDTNVVYVMDAVRGIDVLEVDLPTGAPSQTAALRAPVLDHWVAPDAATAAALEARRDPRWGFACPLPATGR